MVQYLPQQGVVVALTMSRQSPDVQLASAADAALGLVLRQCHLEQLQFPTSTTNNTTEQNQAAIMSYMVSLTSIISM